MGETSKPGIDALSHTREELVRPSELVIAEDIIKLLSERTKQRGTKGEFGGYLLGKGNTADTFIQTGESKFGVVYLTGITTTIRNNIGLLKPWVEQGFKILGGFHNHIQENTNFYLNVGLPAEYTTCPSWADMRWWSMDERKIQEALGQADYPRIISAFLEADRDVIFGAFNLLRLANIDEASTLSSKPIDLNRAVNLSYPNPRVLINKGIIQLISLSVVNPQGKMIPLPNALVK